MPTGPRRAIALRNQRTKCWTEAPDGPFRNGNIVDGGSVNIAVRLTYNGSFLRT